MNIKASIAGAALVFVFCTGAFAACGGEETVCIELEREEYTLALEEGYAEAEISARATADGRDASQRLTYSVSDPAVLEAEGNRITARGKGEAEVLVRCGEEEKRVKVEVLEKIPALDVTDETQINYYGRVFERDGSMVFNNTASGFEVNFIGSGLSAAIEKDGTGSLKVWVDGEISHTLTLNDEGRYALTENLNEGLHTVKVLKMTEQGYLKTALSSLSTDGCFLSPKRKAERRLEFYGDSITSGFGNLGRDSGFYMNEDGTDTYATKAAALLGAQAYIQSYSGISACIPTKNASFTMLDIYDKLYADTQEKWDFGNYRADAVIVSLGTNDANGGGLEGQMYEGYKALLEKLHAAQPQAAIVCVYGMMGIDRYIDREIARAVNELDATGEYKIIYSALSANRAGDMDHPDLEGHETAALELKELIESVW